METQSNNAKIYLNQESYSGIFKKSSNEGTSSKKSELDDQNMTPIQNTSFVNKFPQISLANTLSPFTNQTQQPADKDISTNQNILQKHQLFTTPQTDKNQFYPQTWNGEQIKNDDKRIAQMCFTGDIHTNNRQPTFSKEMQNVPKQQNSSALWKNRDFRREFINGHKSSFLDVDSTKNRNSDAKFSIEETGFKAQLKQQNTEGLPVDKLLQIDTSKKDSDFNSVMTLDFNNHK